MGENSTKTTKWSINEMWMGEGYWGIHPGFKIILASREI